MAKYSPRKPLLLVISDRPNVWAGFNWPKREVHRWVGEREPDAVRSSTIDFAGDPTNAATYRWAVEAPELNAMIDLRDHQRAASVVQAIQEVRPDAAVLLITSNGPDIPIGTSIVRSLPWRDALRGSLDAELRKLDAVRRLHRLRDFANVKGDVAILLHADPDPDALASALALRVLIRRGPDTTPIVSFGPMTRPENRRMAKLLHMQVTVIPPHELQKLDQVIALDFQPPLPHVESPPRLAIIDHHPVATKPVADFVDIRPTYGANSTIMTEYLRLEDEDRITDTLATALLNGIKTDTDSLARGCCAVDVKAYAFLQNKADSSLLRMFERPSYTEETARKIGAATAQLEVDRDLAVAFLGEVDESESHVIANLADFLLALESVTWSVAGAIVDDSLTLGVRRLGGEPGAGDLAKALAGDHGEGGGHTTMGRAVIPMNEKWRRELAGDVASATAALKHIVREQLDSLQVNPRSSHPARQGKVPSAAT